MKKSLVSLLLLVVMLFNILALAGCDFVGGNKTTIRFYHTMGDNLEAVLVKYIAEFNKLYPEIEIVQEPIGGYDDVRDQISKELMVGGQPHLAYCYPDHVALYNLAGAVQTLDGFISSTATTQFGDGTEVLGFTQAQLDDFIDAYYDEGKQFGDGLMYTLPMQKSTEVLYYNKTFFEENNLTPPTTWEEMAEVCAAIKALKPDAIPLGYDSEDNWFITLAEQYGSGYTSEDDSNRFIFDNETNREFVKMLNDWYNNKHWITTKALNGDSYTSNLFKEQKSYMSIGSSAGATHQRPAAVDDVYPFDVGIVPIPQVDLENPKAISQGPSLCMFKASEKEMEATWLFMKFLTTNLAFQAAFSIESGYMPVIESVMQYPKYKAHMEGADGGAGIAALSVKVGLSMVDMYYTSPAFNGSSKARDEVGELLTVALGLSQKGEALDAEIKRLFEEAIYDCKYAK